MEQLLKIKNAIKNRKLEKKSNGVNVFNLMKSQYNKDNSIRKFILDFNGISSCAEFVFREIFGQMRRKLEGEFQVEIVNANPMVIATFKMALEDK